jgi:hypothetical protein
MRVADRLPKSVASVSQYEADESGESFIRFGGTAFVVGVLMEGSIGFAHLVTARHVAFAVNKSVKRGTIRTNTPSLSTRACTSFSLTLAGPPRSTAMPAKRFDSFRRIVYMCRRYSWL